MLLISTARAINLCLFTRPQGSIIVLDDVQGCIVKLRMHQPVQTDVLVKEIKATCIAYSDDIVYYGGVEGIMYRSVI